MFTRRVERRCTVLAVSASDVLADDRVVAVVRAEHVPDGGALASSLVRAGVRCVEITLTVSNALPVIERLARESDCVVGAGTVTTEADAVAALAAGARFLVSPVAPAGVLRTGLDAGVPVLAGALTPTEILRASDLGAAAVKVFPARLGGPQYFEDLRGPFPHLRLVPSGGVDASNAAAYLGAGAFAVSAGSSVAPPELVIAGRWDEIERRARGFVATIDAFRHQQRAEIA
jgi:2-dehydro-3-deoxyphosphogluconate aldolase/(4S)-4-hydroxy-2-oxoglutarate aldolase